MRLYIYFFCKDITLDREMSISQVLLNSKVLDILKGYKIRILAKNELADE